ncbi:hypothetical protein [Nitrosophilus kaiyonis]|uniref:hypothetical protein n=1 Tax=Nitrosophilus kaiyonis TaxID=2930200 RepID=UPI0024925E6D|nr:hypothetical protein [Nitrosophilus kaiyonis]
MIATGFKKKYFSLQAITATVSFIKQKKRKVIICSYKNPLKILSSNDDPPPCEEINLDENSKPCYCNIFFSVRAKRVLSYSRIHKPKLCSCRYTKSGLAPPNISY